MIVTGPQNIYSGSSNLESQSPLNRPEIGRGQRAGTTSRTENGLRTEQQRQTAVQSKVDVNSQDVKSLSNFFNTYRSYVNQIEASDQLVDRVSSGISNKRNLLG